MARLCVHTIFDPKSSLPRCTGIKWNDTIIIKHLYRANENKLIKNIHTDIDDVRNIILKADDKGHNIIITNWKQHLSTLNIPLRNEQYNVYDFDAPIFKSQNTKQQDAEMVTTVLNSMGTTNLNIYRKILSNAIIVYQYLENKGVLHGDILTHPKWATNTFTGRSKTSGFNIQGSPVGSVRGVNMTHKDVFIHFDWMAADFRIASILSNDEKLAASFGSSDPYTATMQEINAESEETITRDEAKLYLLSCINNLDTSSDAINKLYPNLVAWIKDSRIKIRDRGYSCSILGRKFHKRNSKNANRAEWAVFNAMMQGSVAHAMQIVLRKIWERLGDSLICETHDSITISCHRDYVMPTIKMVVDIMLRPFAGVLDIDYVFPLRVSIGKKWRKYRLFEIHRENGVERPKNVIVDE